MGENGRACEWGKATPTSSPGWYLYTLGLKLFSRHICHTPPDTAHGRPLGHPQTPRAASLRQQPYYLAELFSPTGSSAGQGRRHAAPFQAWGYPVQRTSSPALGQNTSPLAPPLAAPRGGGRFAGWWVPCPAPWHTRT